MRATILATVAAGLVLAGPASAARVKDIATIEGMRTNQLSGYGLIAGLNGTGDSQQSIFTVQSVLNMLRRQGLTLNVNPRQLQLKNVAAVSLTAVLPPFARQGTRIDVLVSSLGDAKTLQGGTLLQTPLSAADGQVYVVAQGPLSLEVRAAPWVPVSTARVYVNGVRAAELAIERGRRQQVPLSFAADASVTVEVEGRPDATYAAVVPKTVPFAFSNPIFVDADGDGAWKAPGLPRELPPALATPLAE